MYQETLLKVDSVLWKVATSWEGRLGQRTVFCWIILLLDCFVVYKKIFIGVGLIYRASLVAQSVKNLPAVQETRVWSLGWEDPLEKEMATHSSILAWKISWTEEPGGLQSTGSQRVGHDWATNTVTHSIAWWETLRYSWSHKQDHSLTCSVWKKKRNQRWSLGLI